MAAPVLVGAVGGQVALAASLPLVAAVYGPAALGRFAILLAAAQLAAIAASLRLEGTLPRCSDGDARSILKFIAVSGTVLPSAISTAAVLAGGLSWQEGVGWTFLTVTTALLGTVVMLAVRAGNLRANGRIRAVNGVATAVLLLVFGLLWASPVTLMLAYGVGNLVASISLRGGDLGLGMIRAASVAPGRSARSLARSAAALSGSALLTSANLAAPTWFAALAYGESATGVFWLARTVLVAPTQLLASAMSEVTYAASAGLAPTDLRVSFLSWRRQLAAPSTLIAALGIPLGLVLEYGFSLGEYEGLGLILAIMSIPASLQAWVTSFSYLLVSLGKEGVQLMWSMHRSILIAGLLYVVWVFEIRPGWAVALYSLVLCIVYVQFMVLLNRATVEAEMIHE